MTYQIISEILNWSKKTAEGTLIPAKKIAFEANDYNFNMILFQGGADESTKNNFTEVVKIQMSQTVLRNFTKGLLNGFLTKLRGNTFRKATDELKDEVFFDGRQTIKNDDILYVVRLIGGFKINNGKRIRHTVLKLYKLNTWGEIAEIRETKKYNEDKCIFSAHLSTNSVVEDCFSPEDRICIESFYDIFSSILTGCNTLYASHLQQLAQQRAENKNPQAGGAGTVAIEESSDFEF